MRRVHLRPLLICLVVLQLAACDMSGSPGAELPAGTAAPTAVPTATPAPTPTPTPAQLSAKIGAAMLSVQSFHFAIGVSGKPIATDQTGDFSIMGVEGDLQRPANVLATIKVTGGGAIAEVRLVSMESKQFVTNPITRQWQCVQLGALFNPAVLFDPSSGVEHMLQSEYKDVALVGTEDLGGRPHVHLRGSLAGPPLMNISANAIGFGTVQADVWADAETLRVGQIVLVDPATDAANPTTLKLTFSDYGKAVDVREPAGAQC